LRAEIPHIATYIMTKCQKFIPMNTMLLQAYFKKSGKWQYLLTCYCYLPIAMDMTFCICDHFESMNIANARKMRWFNGMWYLTQD